MPVVRDARGRDVAVGALAGDDYLAFGRRGRLFRLGFVGLDELGAVDALLDCPEDVGVLVDAEQHVVERDGRVQRVRDGGPDQQLGGAASADAEERPVVDGGLRRREPHHVFDLHVAHRDERSCRAEQWCREPVVAVRGGEVDEQQRCEPRAVRCDGAGVVAALLDLPQARVRRAGVGDSRGVARAHGWAVRRRASRGRSRWRSTSRRRRRRGAGSSASSGRP